MSRILTFGIPELDRMLDLDPKPGWMSDLDGPKPDEKSKTSIAIVGPDGTGKSVLALHLAAQYRVQFPAAHVFYVSTDLTYASAVGVWDNFLLRSPAVREIPSDRARRRLWRYSRLQGEAVLIGAQPRDVATYLAAEPQGVVFLDLASYSAGDDWGFLSRLAGQLSTGCDCGHLIVIDSIAGLEAFSGEIDAYGERVSRRGRIAQLMRAVAGACNLALVVEEPRPGEVLPEEYVTDSVIRLRRSGTRGLPGRTIEIEKSRGRDHALGQHNFDILSNRGTSTGRWENPDEPPCNNAYVQIYYSIPHRDRRVRSRRRKGTSGLSGHPAAFGIENLDEMLPRAPGAHPPNGLHWGSLTVFSGDPGTGKSDLACAFLCEAMSSYADNLRTIYSEADNPQALAQTIIGLCGKVLLWRPGVKDPKLATFSCEEADAPGQDEPKLTDTVKVHIQDAVAASDWRRVSDLILQLDRSHQRLFCGNDLESSLFHIKARQLQSLNVRPDADIALSRQSYPWVWVVGPSWPDTGDTLLSLANWLLSHPAFSRPMVLITTNDVKSDDLARTFTEWLEVPSEWRLVAESNIARQLVCRRLDVQGASAARLFHTIERCYIEAQRLIFGPVLPPFPEDRSRQSWKIRLVVDDCRVIRDMYPGLADDPLFLPFFRFSLGSEGITGLVIDSDAGRPDQQPSNEWSRDLRSMASHQIQTWPAPFFGSSVSAIAVVPGKGLIRQLTFSGRRSGSPKPQVDPEFELYDGIERGIPTPVPLQVRCYAETSAWRAYLAEENQLFTQIFGSNRIAPPEVPVIVGMDAAEYDSLRDVCDIRIDTRRDHALVFQVDGFWAFRRDSAGLNMQDYLTRPLTQTSDPYELFRSTSEQTAHLPDTDKKINYFRKRTPRYYSTRLQETDHLIDRIPFSWDFGFLMVKADYWYAAQNEPLEKLVDHCARLACGQANQLEDAREKFRGEVTVGNVLAALNIIDTPQAPRAVTLADFVPGAPGSVRLDSWRAFLEAARVVAATASARLGRVIRPYEVATSNPESMSCQVLEIWLSEIFDSLDEAARETMLSSVSPVRFNFEVNDNRRDRVWGLVQLLSSGAECNLHEMKCLTDVPNRNWELLYQTWLLLLEVLDFDALSTSGPGDASMHRSEEAVASRHWFKTACPAAAVGEKTGHSSEMFVPLRLPGHFSTRGDWYLSAAKGSRSERLAHRAIDLLSSRRANLRRMQLGIGLPVRDILPDETIGQLRTGLRSPIKGAESSLRPGKAQSTRNLTYEELTALGACDFGGPDGDPYTAERAAANFYWLWRTGLEDYDQQSRVWGRWLGRLFSWTNEYTKGFGRAWTDSFECYDQMVRNDPDARVRSLRSLRNGIPELISLLITELKQAKGHPRSAAIH